MPCSQCGGTDAFGKDGLCRVCRARKLGHEHSPYTFTDALRDELRRAYRLRRLPRAEAIDKLVERTGWPRAVFYREATRQGWVSGKHRAWTPEEDAWLQEKAGDVTLNYMAMKLGRSKWSIKARAVALGLSLRTEGDGYTAADLSGAMGVLPGKVRSWMKRGLLGRVEERSGIWTVADVAVERFLRQHPHEYDLRMVDQVWFKSLVFGVVAA